MQREEALKLLKENLKNPNLQKHCLAVEAGMRELARHFNEGEENRFSSSPTESCLRDEGKEENEVLFAFAIAREDEEKWGLCGLLHDIDYEKTKGDPNLHSKMGAEMLKNLGLDEEICQAVLSHNEAHGILPESKMAKALFCLDPLTGLIVAATLVLPSPKTELPLPSSHLWERGGRRGRSPLRPMEANRRDKSLLHPSLRLGQVKKRTKSSSSISDLRVENVLNRFKEKSFARGANRDIIKQCQEYLGLSLEEFVKIVLLAMQKISVELGL